MEIPTESRWSEEDIKRYLGTFEHIDGLVSPLPYSLLPNAIDFPDLAARLVLLHEITAREAFEHYCLGYNKNGQFQFSKIRASSRKRAIDFEPLREAIEDIKKGGGNVIMGIHGHQGMLEDQSKGLFPFFDDGVSAPDIASIFAIWLPANHPQLLIAAIGAPSSFLTMGTKETPLMSFDNAYKWAKNEDFNLITCKVRRCIIYQKKYPDFQTNPESMEKYLTILGKVTRFNEQLWLEETCKQRYIGVYQLNNNEGSTFTRVV